MHAETLNSLLVAIPLLLVLVAGVLRVDEHMFTPEPRKKLIHGRRRFAVSEESGEVVLTDPDGRPFGVRTIRSK
jgi:hypothetical protein